MNKKRLLAFLLAFTMVMPTIGVSAEELAATPTEISVAEDMAEEPVIEEIEMEEPVEEEIVIDEFEMEEPVEDESVIDEFETEIPEDDPVIEEIETGEPIEEEPVIEEIETEELIEEEPVIEELETEEPIEEEPVVDEIETEEPIEEEPAIEEIEMEEPIEEELVIDEPEAEEPVQNDMVLMEEEEDLMLMATASGTCGTGVNWELDSYGTLQISGDIYSYPSMKDYTKGTAPWYRYRSSIKSIYIENGISRIGNYAFYGCTAATSVDFGTYGGSVIGEGAFYNCSSISSFYLPSNTLCMIEDYAFYGCNPSIINIPEYVNVISDKAFVNCKVKAFSVSSYNSYFSAKSGVLLNKDGTELIAYPSGATATSYTLPYSVEKIRPYAFSENSILQTVSMNSSSAQLTEIGEGAFAGCTALTKVTLPGGLKSIGTNTFSLDTLTTATYPCTESVWDSWVTTESGNEPLTDIMTYGTAGHPSHPACGTECRCTDTTHSITYWSGWNGTANITGTYFYLKDDVVRESWYNISGTVVICLNDHSIITNGKAPGFEVTSTGSLFIVDCGTNGTIDSSDTGVSSAERAIDNFGRFTLRSGTLIGSETGIYDNPGSVFTKIYGGTVKGRTAIEGGNVTVYDGVIDGHFYSGGESTIYGGTFLDEVHNVNGGTMTISGGTISIDTHELYQAGILNQGTMTIEDVNVSFVNGGYGDAIRNTGSLHLKGGTFPAVTHTDSYTTQYYSLYNGHRDAKAYVSGSPELEAVSVQYPQTLSFKSMDGSEVYDADNELLFRVDPGTFKSGIAATNVTDEIAANITQINYLGEESTEDGPLFHSGTNLVFAPNSGKCGENLTWTFNVATGTLTISGTGEMYKYDEDDEKEEYQPWYMYADNITSVIFHDGITKIGYYAFSDCDGITSVTIPDSVNSISEGAFVNCSNLQTVDLGDGCSLGDMAFAYCPVKNLNLGGTGSFGIMAFSSSYLTSITITANSPSFDEGAFWSCSNLKEVHFKGTAPWRVIDKGWVSSLASFRDDVTWYYDCSKSGWLTSSRYNAANKTWAGYTMVSENHVYNEKVVAPTCTEQGYTAQECACGDSYPVADTYVPAKGHTEVIDEAKAPTCTETGLTAGKHCSVCGTVIEAQTVVPEKGHTEVIDEAKAPTCTETGLTAGKHCSVCGTVIEAQTVIPEKGHAYTSEITTEATCKKEGVMTYTCQNDPSHTYTEAISAKPHTEVVLDGEDATCTDTGVTEGKYCSVCGTMIAIPEEIPAKGHTEVIDEAVESTCTETGLTEGKHCSVCGVVIVAQETTAKKDHTEVIDEAVESTCEEEGLTAGKHCSVCGTVTVAQEVVPAKPHTEVTIKGKEATCTTTGKTDGKYCSVCMTMVVAPEEIPAKGHTEETIEGKEVTCTEDGLTEGKRCTVCGVTTEVQEVIPSKGHTEETIEGKEATCTEDGLTDGKHCTVCGVTTEVQEVIPSKGHTEETIEGKEATCTEDGLTDGKHCTVCGVTTEVQEVIPSKGHTEETIEGKKATCTEDGLTEGKRCTVCGETTEEQEVIPSKGHTEETIEGKEANCTEDGLTEGRYCTVCGVTTEAQEVIPSKGHTEETIEGKEATCTEDGLTDGKRCTVCGVTTETQEVIPSKGHTEATIEGKEATCTEDGLTEGKHCTVCGVTTEAQEVIPSKGHAEATIEGKAPTCTETGLTEGKRCTVCGVTTEAQEVIPSKGHTEVVDEGRKVTCTEDGLTEGKHCSVCGEVLKVQFPIPAIGHFDSGFTSKAPTCTETGLTEYQACVVCGVVTVEPEVIPATGHDYYATETKAATCKETGVMTYICMNDSSHRYTEEIPFTDHSGGIIIEGKEPTCTETGLTTSVICRVCGVTTEEPREIPAKGHSGGVVVFGKNPTCTEPGVTSGVRCKDCGAIVSGVEEIPAKGHTEVIDKAKAPTCTETGLTDGKHCTVCGVTTKAQEVVPSKGHTEATIEGKAPTCTEDGLTEGKHCTICGVTTVAQTVIPSKGHTEAILPYVAPTKTSTGLTEGKYCSVCGTTLVAQTVIPMLTGVEEVARVYGTSRCDTAMKAADTLKEVMNVSKFNTVIVANAQNFADALGGSYLAAAKDAPILMTNIQSEAKVKDYIRNNLKQGGTIYILGGPLAVASSFESGMDGFNVKRLYGTSRYDTNLAILKEAGVKKRSEVLVCTGTNFADSLSASATGKPILMVGNSLTGNQKAYLESLAAEYTIIGGPLAVNANVETELNTLGDAERIYGISRFDTSVVVAKQFFRSPEAMVLAYAQNFPDGLSGGPLAYQVGGPLVLTQTGKHAAAMTYASENNIQNGYVMGGPMLISDDTTKTIFGTTSIGIK